MYQLKPNFDQDLHCLQVRKQFGSVSQGLSPIEDVTQIPGQPLPVCFSIHFAKYCGCIHLLRLLHTQMGEKVWLIKRSLIYG